MIQIFRWVGFLALGHLSLSLLLSRALNHERINQQNERETLSSDEGTALGQLPWLCLSMSEISVDPGKLAGFFPAAWGLTRT